MLPSVQAFLAQIVDYAGMFPPAKLPLEDALANYLRERQTSPHAWMLGRFVCPASRLSEVNRVADAQLPITALGQQAAGVDQFVPQLDADLRAIDEFRAEGRVVDALELALPKDVPITSLLNVLPAVHRKLASGNLRGYLEIPFSSTWHAEVDQLTECLRELNQGIAAPIGMKLRSGGLAAGAFPSDAQVAHFIIGCRDAAVPWKATAGLHHPRRHWDAALNLWHHGFLNVFGAGVLAHALPLTEADLIEILADRDAQHFRFAASGFAWQDWSCSVAQIEEARLHFASSFGSCSFTEPCEDLLAMGLLDTDECLLG